MSANHPIRRRLIALALVVAPWAALAIRTVWLDYRDRQTREPVPGAWQSLGEVHYTNVPLDQVVADISARAHVRIDADWRRLRAYEVKPETPVTLRLFDVPLAVVLRMIERIAEPAHFTIEGDHVALIVRSALPPMTKPTLRAYDVRSFVPRPGGALSAATRDEEIGSLLSLVEQASPGEWQDVQFNPSSIVNVDSGAGQLTYRHGWLFVWQTPENQFLVADVIRKLPRILSGDAREQPVRLVHSLWEKP